MATSPTPRPPKKSQNILSDIVYFLFSKPAKETLISFDLKEKRENFKHRIMQRMGIAVDTYSILNIHQIGINAPLKYVYEDLLSFDADSSYWPNQIATLDRTRDTTGDIRFYLFGKRKSKFLSILFKPEHFQIFRLNPMKIQDVPDSSDVDNARYLLFKCSGGYPIGFFSIYARSSVTDQGETEATQLFFTVGFNFYGKKSLSKIWILNKAWEVLHNRVTVNVLNRYKQLCEYQFDQIQKGENGFRA